MNNCLEEEHLKADVCEVGFQCYYCRAKNHIKRQCPRLSTEARDRLQKLHQKRQQDSADLRGFSRTSFRKPKVSKEAYVGESRRPAYYNYCF